MALPATRTGVHANRRTNELEYWFVVGNRKTKIGGCSMAQPQSVRDAWERQTTRELRELISRKVKDGTLRVDVPPVADAPK
jgi:hypothetical protein